MSYTKLGCLGTDVVTKLANLRKDLSLESYIMSDTNEHVHSALALDLTSRNAELYILILGFEVRRS